MTFGLGAALTVLEATVCAPRQSGAGHTHGLLIRAESGISHRGRTKREVKFVTPNLQRRHSARGWKSQSHLNGNWPKRAIAAAQKRDRFEMTINYGIAGKSDF